MGNRLDAVIILLSMANLICNVTGEKGNEMTLAVQSQNLSILECLIGDGRFNVNEKDRKGNTALILAAQANLPKFVDALLAVPGIDVNATNFEFDCALAFAAAHRNPYILQRLAEREGIIANIQNNQGLVPLAIAFNKRLLDHQSILLRIPGIDVTIMSVDGDSPITGSIDMNNVVLFEMIMDVYFAQHPEKDDPATAELLQLVERYLGSKPSGVEPFLEVLTKYTSG
jgi:ankyrin repeat protein